MLKLNKLNKEDAMKFLDLISRDGKIEPPKKIKEVATTVTPSDFRAEFLKLASHLRDRDYSPDDFAKLQTLVEMLDCYWESELYEQFRNIINRMMAVHGTLRNT